MLQNSPIGAWIKDLPDILQYMVVIALVLVILYVCLVLTRLLGQRNGEKVHYDDPEAYEKTLPDISASRIFRKKEGKDK